MSHLTSDVKSSLVLVFTFSKLIFGFQGFLLSVKLKLCVIRALLLISDASRNCPRNYWKPWI